MADTLDPSVIDTIIAEAVGGGVKGMTAVAAVIRNRAEQRDRTPFQIISAPKQFEGYTNPGPGVKGAQRDPAIRRQVQEIWNGLQSGTIPDPVRGGTQFHSAGMTPTWAKSANQHGTQNIGGNVFYLGDAAPRSAPKPAEMTAATAAARMAGQQPQNGGSKSLMAYAPNIASSKQGEPVVPLTRPNAAERAEFAGAAVGLRANDAAQSVARAAAKAGDAIPAQTPKQMLNSGNLQGQLSDYIERQGQGSTLQDQLAQYVERQGQPLTTRKVQTVPIDPRTGMPATGTAQPVQAQGQSPLQLALDRYVQKRQAATVTPPQGQVTGTVKEIYLPKQTNGTATAVQPRQATAVPTSGYIQGVDPSEGNTRLLPEPRRTGQSLPPNLSGIASYTVGADGQPEFETAGIPLPKRRPQSVMNLPAFGQGDELLPGDRANEAAIEAERQRRNAIAAQDPFAFAGEPPPPGGALGAAFREGGQKMAAQAEALMNTPREPSWYEQQTGNRGSYGSARDMIGQINTNRLIDYFTRGAPQQTQPRTLGSRQPIGDYRNSAGSAVGRSIPGFGSFVAPQTRNIPNSELAIALIANSQDNNGSTPGQYRSSNEWFNSVTDPMYRG